MAFSGLYLFLSITGHWNNFSDCEMALQTDNFANKNETFNKHQSTLGKQKGPGMK